MTPTAWTLWIVGVLIVLLMMFVPQEEATSTIRNGHVEENSFEIHDTSGRCWHFFLGKPYEGGMQPIDSVIKVSC